MSDLTHGLDYPRKSRVDLAGGTFLWGILLPAFRPLIISIEVARALLLQDLLLQPHRGFSRGHTGSAVRTA